MKMLITGATIALSMLIGTSALAARPVSGIDCVQLEASMVAVNDFLDDNTGITFTSLGNLVATALVESPATGGLLTGLINEAYNDGPLPPESALDTTPFTSAKQVITTIAGCGLTKLLIDQIND